MDLEEMERRREEGLSALDQAIDALGPITDETPSSIREPVLEVIDAIERAGKDLQDLNFRVYESREDSE